jgi:hypothetical protein
MSLAAMKLKLKNTKGIKIGYKPDWMSNRKRCYGGNKHIKDSKPTISYQQYTNNLRLCKQKNRGDCSKEIVLDPHKKPHFFDKSSEHRIDILNTNHLKKENVKKLKHKHKVALDGCRDHALNILGDDSGTVRTAEHVLNKRKACLIGKPAETVIKVIEIDNSLFVNVRGRGSILSFMDVEIFVKMLDGDLLLKIINNNPFQTDETGEATISIEEMKTKNGVVDKNNVDYYIFKLVPTERSVNKQLYGEFEEGRETKIVLDYYARINGEQIDKIFNNVIEITPLTNLIFTTYFYFENDGLFTAIIALTGAESEEDLQSVNNGKWSGGQNATLKPEILMRITLFDMIRRKIEIEGTAFWNINGTNDALIKKLIEDMGITPIDEYILALDESSPSETCPINKDHYNELQVMCSILNISADKLNTNDIDEDDWDDITNTMSQIIVNTDGYIYEGSIKTEIYDVSVSNVPKTKIFDVSTDFGFLDRGDGSGATNVDYGWD